VTWAGAVFLVVAFLCLVRALGLRSLAGDVARHARAALAVLRDGARSDADKARALRAQSVRLLGLCLAQVALVAAALAVPLGALALLDLAGAVALDAVLELTLRPVFLIATTAIAVLWLAVARAPARAAKRPLE
jgi:hypothetical protein